MAQATNIEHKLLADHDKGDSWAACPAIVLGRRHGPTIAEPRGWNAMRMTAFFSLQPLHEPRRPDFRRRLL